MCMSEGCCAAAMGRWERSRVRAHVEFTEVGYIQLLLRMCATIRYHFRVVPLRDDKGVLRQRCKMRLIFVMHMEGYISWNDGWRRRALSSLFIGPRCTRAHVELIEILVVTVAFRRVV